METDHAASVVPNPGDKALPVVASRVQCYYYYSVIIITRQTLKMQIQKSYCICVLQHEQVARTGNGNWEDVAEHIVCFLLTTADSFSSNEN